MSGRSPRASCSMNASATSATSDSSDRSVCAAAASIVELQQAHFLPQDTHTEPRARAESLTEGRERKRTTSLTEPDFSSVPGEQQWLRSGTRAPTNYRRDWRKCDRKTGKRIGGWGLKSKK